MEDRRREKEEKLFSELIESTFSFFSDEELDEDKIDIINAFHYETGATPREIHFDEKETRLAYFDRHGPVSTGVADFMISKALVEIKPETILPEKDEIKIVDLGAGHGCGTVGLCSAFNAYLQGKKVQLTLVDEVEEWKYIFGTMKNLLESKNFGNASQFFKRNEVNITYECADLKYPEKNENFRRSLNEADILLLSRVLTFIERPDIDIIARAIVKEMKKGAVLIFIDCLAYYIGSPYPVKFKEMELIYSIKDEKDEKDEYYRFTGTDRDNVQVSKKTKAKIFVLKKN